MAVAEASEERMVTYENMKKRVDRLMRSVQNEVQDGDLRVKAITRLIEVRELFGSEEED